MNFWQFIFWTHPNLSILPIIVLYCILSSFKFPVNNSDFSLSSYIIGLCVFLLLFFLYWTFSWDTFFSVFLQLSLLWSYFQKSDPKPAFIFSPKQSIFWGNHWGCLGIAFMKETENILLALPFFISWNTKLSLLSAFTSWAICHSDFCRYTLCKNKY